MHCILLFRLKLDVGIEDFRVLIHGCTTVVADGHWLVIYYAVRGCHFGGEVAEHGELFKRPEEMRTVGGGRGIIRT